MHLLIWIAVIARGEATFAETVSWGFRFWLASIPILGIWCAFSVLISSFFRTPILALLLNAGFNFMWWLVYFMGWSGPHFATPGDETAALPIPAARPLMFIFPNFYDRFLLSPHFGQVAIGLVVTLGVAALCVTATSLIVQRRDI